jgi:hypothetical protein
MSSCAKRARARQVLALTCALVMLAGCAALPPRNPPRIDVVGVQLDRVEGADAYFNVAVRLTNDGDEDFVIRALSARLAIEGENVAEATLASAPVRIAAHGSTRAELSSRTGMDQVLRAIAAAMRRGATLTPPGARPTLRYAIDGTATLDGGYRLRFAHAGDIGDVPR